MVIDNDNSDADVSQSKPKPEHVDANLYKESLTSVNGFTRGPNGKIKFHKDTKKRRREEMSDDDVEMADTVVEEGVSKSKKRNEVKVGQEFKAKVRSAPHSFLRRKGVDWVHYSAQVAMSRRTAWSHMHTSHLDK